MSVLPGARGLLFLCLYQVLQSLQLWQHCHQMHHPDNSIITSNNTDHYQTMWTTPTAYSRQLSTKMLLKMAYAYQWPDKPIQCQKANQVLQNFMQKESHINIGLFRVTLNVSPRKCMQWTYETAASGYLNYSTVTLFAAPTNTRITLINVL